MTETRFESASALQAEDVVRDASLDASTQGDVRHAFFTRSGGVSGGLYRGLNAGAGSDDDPEAVSENRRRAVAFLGLEPARLATPWQVHSPDVVVVDAPFAGERPKADAVVTATPGLAVGVVTADCGPVLLSDPQAGVVAAAHAGWRGAVGGVLEATVAAMERAGARRGAIRAVLGPTITGPNYEVGADMARSVIEGDGEAEAFFSAGTSSGKRQFDLPGLILSRLARAGVDARFVGRCTYGEEDLFFSFRRATHRGEPDYGRQLSAIVAGAPR